MATISVSTDPQYPRHIPSVHYTDPPTRLQTLDIWLPRPLQEPRPKHTVWIVYVHGGAWRDPTQDSACVQPTIKHLQKSFPASLDRIAGIASLNYRLSPYPSHPSSPSDPGDPSRNVTHPSHIRDVAHAIKYLCKHYSLQEQGNTSGKGSFQWIGVGHSAGATLLLQLVAGIGLDVENGLGKEQGPEALILLEGIYDIPLLLKNHEPPSCPPEISKIYEQIIEGAFRSDETVYHSVSPTSGSYSASDWPKGRLIVLAHSPDDELVEEEQRSVMRARLGGEGWTVLSQRPSSEMLEKQTDGRLQAGTSSESESQILEIKDLEGGHDEIWEDGRQIAKLIEEVVRRLHG